MKQYKLQLEILSPALVGSGVGYGSNIDTDVVFDDLGLPFVPAKRVKGCLLDAVRDAETMFSAAGLTSDQFCIEKTFGKPGEDKSAPLCLSNLYIENYRQNRDWINYFLKSKKYNLITPQRILKTFTEIRQQTKINNGGVTFKHSLRTSRVLNKGLTFQGDVRLLVEDEQIIETLLLACLNFRRFGTNRNRGFGDVSCSLSYKGTELSVYKKLEDLCTD